MNKLTFPRVILAVAMLAFAGAASAVVDTVQANTGFFVPSDAQKYDAPYYRWQGEDWDWQHSAIGGTITSADLNISAFDVDASSGEVDTIFGWNNDTSAWDALGNLAGGSDIWSFTNFSLAASWFDEIAAGLKVKIGIDQNHAGWAVSLSKSVLRVNGGELPTPNPSVPLPAAAFLFAPGLLGLGFMSKKRKPLAA